MVCAAVRDIWVVPPKNFTRYSKSLFDQRRQIRVFRVSPQCLRNFISETMNFLLSIVLASTFVISLEGRFCPRCAVGRSKVNCGCFLWAKQTTKVPCGENCTTSTFCCSGPKCHECGKRPSRNSRCACEAPTIRRRVKAVCGLFCTRVGFCCSS